MGADTKLTALLIKDNIVLCFRKSSKSPKVNSDAEQTAATTEEAGGTLLRCNFDWKTNFAALPSQGN